MTEHEGLSRDEYETVDFEIAAAEEARSLAHHMNSGGWAEFGMEGATQEDLAEMANRIRTYQLMATDLFLDNPRARTATLGIMRMRGDWRQDWMQRELLEGRFADEPYKATAYTRDDPHNKFELDVDWGVVSMSGVTMLTRRRLLLATADVEQEFVHHSGRRVLGRFAIEVDKLSTFALQVDRLKEMELAAAQDVRSAIAAGTIMSTNMARLRRVLPEPDSQSYQDWVQKNPEFKITTLVSDDADKERRDLETLARVKQFIDQHGLPQEEMLKRLQTPLPGRITSLETIEQIEHAIREQKPVLIPVTTTFYGERVLKSFSLT